MGLYDRDYVRQQTPQLARDRFGTMPLFSVNTWIIIFCSLVFLVDRIFTRAVGVYVVTTPDGEGMRMSPIEYFGHFSAALAIHHHQVWRFVTFQFLHANLTHILFNMF